MQDIDYEDIRHKRYRDIFGTNYIGQESYFTYLELCAYIDMLSKLHGRALDLGCGEGAFACKIASDKRLRVDGIDKDDTKVRLAKVRAAAQKLNDRVNFAVRDLDKDELTVDGHQYDLVYSVDSLQHSNGLSRVFQKIRSLIQGQSIFFATIWAFDIPAYYLGRAWGINTPRSYNQILYSAKFLGVTDQLISENPDFLKKFERSIESMINNREAFELLMGKKGYFERLRLEENSFEACKLGHFSQIIIHAKGNSISP